MYNFKQIKNTNMNHSNLKKAISAAALLFVISISAINSHSRSENRIAETFQNISKVSSATQPAEINVFQKISSEINSLFNNPKVIIRMSGIYLPNHSK